MDSSKSVSADTIRADIEKALEPLLNREGIFGYNRKIAGWLLDRQIPHVRPLADPDASVEEAVRLLKTVIGEECPHSGKITLLPRQRSAIIAFLRAHA